MTKSANADLKSFMLKNGVTQRELAKYLGLHYSTVCVRVNSVMSKDEKDKFKQSVMDCAAANRASAN